MARAFAPGAAIWERAPESSSEAYLPGTVLSSENETHCTVRCGGAELELPAAAISERNPEGDTADNCQLLHLNEACVLYNIEARFAEGKIYTCESP